MGGRSRQLAAGQMCPLLTGRHQSKVGQEAGGDGLLLFANNTNIGPCNPEVQNHNRKQLHPFLHTHYMSIVHTFHSVWPTYYGIVAGYTSHIDYICLPTSLLGSMQRCCIWHATGDELQLVAAPGKRDQRPVQVILEHALVSPQSPAAPGTHWDTDKFTHGVLQREKGPICACG